MQATAMHLDPQTLIVAADVASVLCGTFLILAWLHMRRSTALLWWAVANFANSAGAIVMTVGVVVESDATIVAGLVIANAAPVLIWGGARVFTAGDVRLSLLVTAGVAAVGSTAAAYALGGVADASIVSFATWIAFLAVAVNELWRGRAEKLPARWPLMALFVVHAVIYSGGIYDFLSGTLYDGISAPPVGSWFGLIYFEGILYTMGSALLMSLLCKEREEQKYIAAAHSDPLTGIANRRTFFEQAERLLQRCRKDHQPLALIVFDLDHFKSINDSNGHAVGDEVLRSFVASVRGLLRPNDLFGRHGGEEFAVALPDATLDTATVVAERIRHAFTRSPFTLDGQPVMATVSAGVAIAEPSWTFEMLMNTADMAMYRAKPLGRNRVERMPAAGGGETDRSNVIRVA
jgi:diguanylate cyclase (GGDEF)-like protein